MRQPLRFLMHIMAGCLAACGLAMAILGPGPNIPAWQIAMLGLVCGQTGFAYGRVMMTIEGTQDE